MPLNIKSEEAHRLAGHITHITGESLTQAVTEALRERLSRLQNSDDLAQEIQAIGRDCASRLKEPYRSMDHAELLYDERGLPK